MNLATMEQQTADNVRPAVVQTEQLLSGFVGMKIPQSVWVRMLAVLFGMVSPAADAVAMIARSFYDSERSRVFPGIPRNDVYLSRLSFEKFVEDMQDIRPLFVAEEITPSAVHRASMQVARSVENSGRWTIMHALEAPDPWLDGMLEWDEDSEFVVEETTDEEVRARKRKRFRKGWARVATGKETCGWCLMLVSRGPVYRSAVTAGAVEQVDGSASFDAGEQMRQWHSGCDCKVVPVFDTENFEGYDRWKAAEEMWKRETEGYSGRDAVNAFRRAAESGKYLDYMKK